jgi:hypothetical protein
MYQLRNGQRDRPLEDAEGFPSETIRGLAQPPRATGVFAEAVEEQAPETPPVAGRRRWGLALTLDAIVQVGDTVALEDPGAFKLDVLGPEVVEKAAPLAEEHRDEMDLEFVEDAGSEC